MSTVGDKAALGAVSAAISSVNSQSKVINPAVNGTLSSSNQLPPIISNPTASIGLSSFSAPNLYPAIPAPPPSVLAASLNKALGYGYGLASPYSPWMMQGAQNGAQSNPEQAKIAEKKNDAGDGDTTVVNSTSGKTVSWMSQLGNMLSQEILDEAESGSYFGEVINKIAGRTLAGGGAPQETTLRGPDDIPDNLGSEENPVAEAIALADTNHSDGSNFKNDAENITQASNAKNSSIFDNFSEFKDYLLKRGAEALETGENLVVTIAAHGSPDGGVVVNGEHISKDELNELLDLAGVEVTVNCPCYSQQIGRAHV